MPPCVPTTAGNRSRFRRLRFARAIAGERGSSVVELALAMPMLTLILVGLAELGRLGFLAIEVSGAAAAGAAYGCQNRGTAANSTNIALAASTDAAHVSGLTTTTSTSCTCSDGTQITCANAAANCVSPAHIEEFLQVNTSATVSPIFNYPGISTTWVLHGQTTAMVEQ